MPEYILHSHEVGRRGKPDELDSQLAMRIGAEILRRDKDAKFDIRVAGGFSIPDNHPTVHVAGELSEQVMYATDFNHAVSKLIAIEYEKVVKQPFDPRRVTFGTKPQSTVLAKNEAAGDSGTAIAVAYADTPGFLPWERFLAVEIRDVLDRVYFQQPIPDYIIATDLKRHQLRADGKIEVIAKYEDAKIKSIEVITISVEHDEEKDLEVIQEQIEDLVVQIINYYSREHKVHLGHPKIVVNPHGARTQGGWKTDAGTREAKPQRDAFGSYGLCEDAMCGEDPTKPGVTGTLMARKIAVRIVKHEYAKFARVMLCRQIGQTQPILNITTNGSSDMSQTELEGLVKRQFPLAFSTVVRGLKIKNPTVYDGVADDSDWFQRPTRERNK